MPGFPVTAGKVMEICSKASVNPPNLNRVISLDPVLTGKLFQLVNYVYCGSDTHITSIEKAITMLGVNTVKNLVLSASVSGAQMKDSELNMEDFWRHCLCVGVTSKLLAAKQGIDARYREEYFTAGLLHDIGKLPLNAVLPQDYMRAVASADSKHKPLFEAERESFGINHSDAGAMAANLWKLERPVTDAISYHHDINGYSGSNLHIICNVAAANYFSIVNGAGFAGDRMPVKPDKKVWTTTGLNEDSFEELKEKIFKEIEKANIFLRI